MALPPGGATGPAGAPQGPGTCLAAADPSAPRDAGPVVASTSQTQTLTQTIGVAVRPG